MTYWNRESYEKPVITRDSINSFISRKKEIEYLIRQWTPQKKLIVVSKPLDKSNE